MSRPFRRSSTAGRRSPAGRPKPAAGGHPLFALVLGNFLLSLVISVGYWRHVEPAGWDWGILALETVSQYGGLYVVLGLILWAVTRPLSQRAAGWTAAVFFVLAQSFLVVDMVVYDLFRFHINGLVVNAVATGAVGEDVRLGFQTVATFVVVVGIVAAVQYLLWRLRGHPAVARAAGAAAPMAAAVGLVFAVEKSLYAWGDLTYRPALFKYTRIFPLYVPLGIKRFVSDRWHVLPPRVLGPEYSDARGLLKYPELVSLPCARGARPNILVLVMDSVRFDMLDEATAPFLARFRKRCLDFRMHFTGGISTRYGIFSLLYGLPPTYWETFLGENRGCALIDYLKLDGYRFDIVSSTRLSFPEFWKTAFVKVPEAIHDELNNGSPAERDAAQLPEFFDFLDNRGGRAGPFFAFLFTDSPHNPYSYPDSFEKFKPAAKWINYLDVIKAGDSSHFNRYRNAIHYSDDLVARLMKGLEDRGLADNTIVVITADHGEEFWESGYWGHTSAFTWQQCRIPLLIRAPGVSPRVVRTPTSHMDVVPTLFDLLGCPEMGKRYTAGRSLLHPAPREFWSVTGYRKCAVYSGDRIFVFNMQGGKPSEVEVRDRNYRQVAAAREELARCRPAFMEFLKEQREFLK